MITLGTPTDQIDDDVLATPGGFAWWYLDITDAHGNGLVLIWSFGLPFLPGYASAARRDQAPPARERPSLNICIYRDGELDFYLLQTYAPDAVERTAPGEWRFGQSNLKTESRGDSRHVHVDLDCPIPGSDGHATGRIEASGPRARFDDGALEPSDRPLHEWRLLTATADGSFDITCPDTTYTATGRAYHDCNLGRRPLHDLGIDYWMWGRMPRDDHEFIYYILWPSEDGRAGAPPTDRPTTSFGLTIDDDGHTELHRDLECRRHHRQRSLGGMTWWNRLDWLPATSDSDRPTLSVNYRDKIDSGPFYLRFMTESDGHRGIAECIAPHRIDLARHRPLVNMRVDHRHQTNSMWLPLFSGPKTSRVRRLLGQWW